MIRKHLMPRGINDPKVLEAMSKVPREEFIPDNYREMAYRDGALPIACKQTISQPYIVAWMMQLLSVKPTDRILEIGTGCGYAAAILSQLAEKVYTIERHEELALQAGVTIQRLGYDNIYIKHGDGTQGWSEHAPFDGICVAAGTNVIPSALKKQLAEGGHLIIPLGKTKNHQQMTRITLLDGKYIKEELGSVRFVPLVSDETGI